MMGGKNKDRIETFQPYQGDGEIIWCETCEPRLKLVVFNMDIE